MADKLITEKNGQVLLRFKDMQDSTHAEVISATAPATSGLTDFVYTGPEGIKLKMKNCGDGTFARVLYGA